MELFEYGLRPATAADTASNTTAIAALQSSKADITYVDMVAAGFDPKASVKAIATSNITLSGTQTIDGVALSADDSVLVAGQSTASQNGLYLVKTGAWVRRNDADANAEVTSGLYTFVSQGTIYASTGWALVTADPIVVDTTALTFTQVLGKATVNGPTSSVNGRVATFNGTTGRLLSDGGTLLSDLATTQSVTNDPWKAPCRAATTANITLSGTQTIDGVSVVAGDRVLVKDQSTGSQNGIYVCASGAWARAADADVDSEIVAGMSVRVTEGAINVGGFWLVTTGVITIGTTSLTFEPFAPSYRYKRLNAQTGTTYTFDINDGNGSTLVTLNNASAITATIPANASVAFPIGATIPIMQLGAGQVTVTIASDTLLNPGLTAKLRAQYSMATLTKIASTQWVISGDLAVV